MVRTVWLIPLCIALLIAGLAIAQQAPSEATSEDDAHEAVLAHPNQGDAGTHVYHDDEGQAIQRLHLAWDTMEILLPDGEIHQAPTLTRTFPQDDAQPDDQDTNEQASAYHGDLWPSQPSPLEAPTNDDHADAPSTRHHHTHALSLPGEPIARTYEMTETADEGRLDTMAFASTRLTEDACFAPLSLQLAGQNAANALTILEACIEELYLERLEHDPGDVTIQTEDRWATHEDHGPVWIANVNTTLEDEANDTIIQHDRTLKTSPQASLILEMHARTTGHQDGEEIDRETKTLLEGYQEGQGPLEDADPLGELLSIDTVPWTMQGPTHDDLTSFPLAQAHEAIQRTPDGLAFFQDAHEPRIAHAGFIDQDNNANAPLPSHNANGADCTPPESPSLPHEAGERSWTVSWSTEEDGRLLGAANEHRATQDALEEPTPTQRAIAYASDAGEAWPPFEIAPPLEGPSLTQLWEHRHVIEVLQDEGAWNMEIDAPYEEGQSLEGEIGKVHCIDHGDAFELQQAMIVFQDGTADAITTTAYTRSS